MSEWWQGFLDDFTLNFIDGNRWKFLVSGLGVTLEVTFLSLLVGIFMGTIVAIIRGTYDKQYQEMRPGLGKKLLGVKNGIAKW